MLIAAAVVLNGNVLPAQASSVTTAVFTGGAGTVSSGGTLYAKQGGALTLTRRARRGPGPPAVEQREVDVDVHRHRGCG